VQSGLRRESRQKEGPNTLRNISNGWGGEREEKSGNKTDVLKRENINRIQQERYACVARKEIEL